MPHYQPSLHDQPHQSVRQRLRRAPGAALAALACALTIAAQLPQLPVALRGSVFAAPENAAAPAAQANRARLHEHVSFLASDALGGRDSGEPGLEIAAEYLATELAAMGLEPAGDHGSFFQYFTAPFGADFGRQLGAKLSDEQGETTWAPWIDAMPLAYGDARVVEAPLVFAGYGITTSEDERDEGLAYDDYSGIDVTGKIVIVLRFVPGAGSGVDPFGGRGSPHAPFLSKLRNARKHGAAGVVFVTPPDSNLARSEVASVRNLQGFARRAAPRHPTLPALIARADVVDAVLRRAGRSLAEVVQSIENELKPASFEIPKTRLKFETRLGYALLRNVAAKLPGSGALGKETVVVGGHYDHIGRFGDQVKPENVGKIHNGADDNASGVAGVLELARMAHATDAASTPEEGRRAVIFVLFSGEEIGLLGSRHWVRTPRLLRLSEAVPRDPFAAAGADGTQLVPAGTSVTATGGTHHGFLEVETPAGDRTWVAPTGVEQIAGSALLHEVVAMLNLDMIGRAKKNTVLNVIGSDSSPELLQLLDEVAKGSGGVELNRTRGPGGGGSDHAHFLRREIPALFFFTGIHADYNTPEDDVDRLNLPALEQIVNVIGTVLERVRTMPSAPSFNEETTSLAGHGGGRPKLGVHIDSEFSEPGARVTDVEPESPAAKGNVLAGDVIVRFGNEPISNFTQLVEAVQAAEAGSEVALEVRRDGKIETLRVEFPRPRAGGFRVVFGSVPDYAFSERGVRFEDIRKGSPAAAAGVKAGDVLLRWGDTEIDSVSHWTELLRQHSPGDEVIIKLRRDGKTVEVVVKLRGR